MDDDIQPPVASGRRLEWKLMRSAPGARQRALSDVSTGQRHLAYVAPEVRGPCHVLSQISVYHRLPNKLSPTRHTRVVIQAQPCSTCQEQRHSRAELPAGAMLVLPAPAQLEQSIIRKSNNQSFSFYLEVTAIDKHGSSSVSAAAFLGKTHADDAAAHLCVVFSCTCDARQPQIQIDPAAFTAEPRTLKRTQSRAESAGLMCSAQSAGG
jgi:hypothetical protein